MNKVTTHKHKTNCKIQMKLTSQYANKIDYYKTASLEGVLAPDLLLSSGQFLYPPISLLFLVLVKYVCFLCLGFLLIRLKLKLVCWGCVGPILTGQRSCGLRCQVDGGVSEWTPAHAVHGPDFVLVGLGALQVLDQQHALLRVVDLYLLSGALWLCEERVLV